MRIRSIKPPLWLALSVVCGSAAADPLPQVDAGLWQWTSVLRMELYMMSPARLAALPKAARDSIEAAMAKGRGPRTDRLCLTPEKIRQGLLWQQNLGQICTSRVTISGATLHLDIVCKLPAGKSVDNITLTILDRRTIDGVIEAVRTGESSPPREAGRLHGTWLNADCGDVKP
jgi:hypothetical protein